MSTIAKNKAIKSAKHYLDTVYSHIMKGYKDNVIMISFYSMVNKFDSVNQIFGILNVDVAKYDFIIQKVAEILDKNPKFKKEMLNKARDLRKILRSPRSRQKYDQNHPIMKLYKELKFGHAVICCQTIFYRQRNMMRHIKQKHPDTFVRSSIEKSSFSQQEIHPQEKSLISPSSLPYSCDLIISSADDSSSTFQDVQYSNEDSNTQM